MRILLIEDDKELCALLAAQLQKCGYAVDCCYDGEDADMLIKENAWDCILLDRMLPGIDGLTLLKKIRKISSTPVILITAMGQLKDKIDGLDMGADDYLVKPFAIEELLARIRSIKRRPAKWEDTALIQVGDLTLKSSQATLTGPTGSCTLSKRECSLFEILLSNPGQTLPRSLLLSKIWGPDGSVEEGNLDNYIFFARRRMKSLGSSLTLSTIRGVGYCLKV